MYSFSQYLQHSSPEPSISKFFEAACPILETRLTFENFNLEINAISKFEQTLPDAFGMHLDMILAGGAFRVSQYYQDITGGRARMFERIRSQIGEEKFNRINEALAELKVLLKEQLKPLNEEEALAFGQKIGDLTQDAAIDAALQGTGVDTKPKSTILGIIKDIWNAISDNNDPLSIAQFVIDLIGLWPGAVGIAADGINAAIYFWRGKPFLGLISLIAAVFPIAGDMVKLFKFGKNAKYADDFIKYTMKETAPNSRVFFQQIPPANRGPVMRILNYLGARAASAASKVSSVGRKFFNWLSNRSVLNAFPGVKKFFVDLATRFDNFTKNMTKLADELEYLPKMSLRGGKADVFSDLTKHLADLAPNRVSGKLALDQANKTVKLYNAEGKLIRTFPEDLLLDPGLWVNSPLVSGMLRTFNSADDVVKYFNSLPKAAAAATSTTNKLASIIHKVVRTKIAVAAVIGKQVWKIITGKNAEQLMAEGIPESQFELTGADLWNDAVYQKMQQARKDGALYAPYVSFDYKNDEDYRNIVKYQNDWAKKIGSPEIIPVLYRRAGYPELAEEYETFWKTEGAPTETPKKEEPKDEIGKVSDKTIEPEIAPTSPKTNQPSQYQFKIPSLSNESVSVFSFDKFISSKK